MKQIVLDLDRIVARKIWSPSFIFLRLFIIKQKTNCENSRLDVCGTRVRRPAQVQGTLCPACVYLGDLSALAIKRGQRPTKARGATEGAGCFKVLACHIPRMSRTYAVIAPMNESRYPRETKEKAPVRNVEEIKATATLARGLPRKFNNKAKAPRFEITGAESVRFAWPWLLTEQRTAFRTFRPEKLGDFVCDPRRTNAQRYREQWDMAYCNWITPTTQKLARAGNGLLKRSEKRGGFF